MCKFVHKLKVLKVFTTETVQFLGSNKALGWSKALRIHLGFQISKALRLTWYLKSDNKSPCKISPWTIFIFASQFLWTPAVSVLIYGLFIPWNQHFTLEAKKVFDKAKVYQEFKFWMKFFTTEKYKRIHAFFYMEKSTWSRVTCWKSYKSLQIKIC